MDDQRISTSTVSGVASEYAGNPIDEKRAHEIRESLDSLHRQIASLRELDLEPFEPGTAFRPVSGDEA